MPLPVLAMLADTGIVSVSGIVYDQAKVITTVALIVAASVTAILHSIELPEITLKSVSLET